MKAEFSDAPERIIQRSQKRGVHSLIACLVVGSVVLVSAFLLASRSEFHRTSVAVAPKAQALSDEVGEGAVIRATSASTNVGVNNAPRQTSFNDQNFVPTGAHNIVTFHQASSDTAPVDAPKKVKLTIVGQTPSMKDRACWPFRQGSIEARNCRLSVGLKHRN